MTTLKQKWGLHVSTSDYDKNDDDGSVVTLIVQCGLPDRLVGGTIQTMLLYRYEILLKGEGGGGASHPLAAAAVSDSDLTMPSGRRKEEAMATLYRYNKLTFSLFAQGHLLVLLVLFSLSSSFPSTDGNND